MWHFPGRRFLFVVVAVVEVAVDCNASCSSTITSKKKICFLNNVNETELLLPENFHIMSYINQVTDFI